MKSRKKPITAEDCVVATEIELSRVRKCEAILKAIVTYVNSGDGKFLRFEADWGGNSLTLVAGNAHTHVGDPSYSFDILVHQLYQLLCKQAGLSWVGE